MGCGTSTPSVQGNKAETSQPATSAAAADEPLKVPEVPGSLPDDAVIVFVLGGPGSGKGTQCERIVKLYNFTHLSAGDLLRAEVKSGSTVGQKCEALMKEGKLVPMEVTIALLKNEMIKSGSKMFLIDGFPRAVDQAEAFEKNIKPCKFAVFFECTEAEMERRLLDRGKTSGRSDDNVETIKKRFKTFVTESVPVKTLFEKDNKCYAIDATPAPDEVFKVVKQTFDKELGIATTVELSPQPAQPEGKIYMIECQGGTDKGADGHRRDTIPICNALIKKGWFAEPIFYSDATYDEVFAKVNNADAFIARVNPAKYDGVTQSKLEELLAAAASNGVVAMSHPDVMRKMGAKDALVKIKDLSCGMADTYAYYDVPSFKENFPKTLATGIRVLKQNRGSQGEGIWVVKLKEGETATDGVVAGGTMLVCTEAKDNHVEEHTLDAFMTFCEQYIEGQEGQLIDQRFLPRIVEGEIRVNMIHTTPTELVHKKPKEGGISATLQSGATYVNYKPDDPQFQNLMDNFLKKDLPQVMPAIGMAGQPIPLIWTADFILGDKTDDGQDTYYVGEFNCSCVGITQQMHLADPVAEAAINIIRSTLRPQPAEPAGKIFVIECQGGSDKGADGHRRDTIPICNALIKRGWSAQPIFYSDATFDEVLEKVSTADAYIARINPGKYDGVTQSKLEELLTTLASKGLVAMSHPDVMRKMGAKDALVKIKDLSCGMADTYAYYDIPSFKENFPKTLATGIRVLKQNRGSQGEGIWVVKLKEGETATDGVVAGGAMLVCTEAKDNHVEEHTLDAFMTFCEQYIEGQEGQLIDQRFLPRIVEGEIRVNMIHTTPTELVHKKPKEGGISATLQSGAIYVAYKPDDPQFKNLMDTFLNKDLPQVMPAIGMSDQPIPLIWTADFILGEKTEDGQDTYYVGEFNCSCVGITQQMYLAGPVADAAINIIKSSKKS